MLHKSTTAREAKPLSFVIMGAAASQCVTPRGVRQFGGLCVGGGGGGGGGGWLTQTLGVGGSGGQPPGPLGGGVGEYPNIHTSK